ncbi:MAG TPA: hypothetical protein VHD91_06115 [Gaiellaceae bacterium]|nr:hypothetical protein [Gaiellaceae bacterium]
MSVWLSRQVAGVSNAKPGPAILCVLVSAAVVPGCDEEPQATSKSGTMRENATKRKEPTKMPKTKERVVDAAGTVKPYVDRALHDDELRESVRNAYESARTIYDELVAKRGVTGVATRVATDKDIQAELRSAIEELRNAATRVQGKKVEEDHGGRAATLLLAGIALGVLFNPVTGPQTRKWLTDRLFGGDGDDFTYQGNGSGS